jgi:hypothetical protein
MKCGDEVLKIMTIYFHENSLTEQFHFCNTYKKNDIIVLLYNDIVDKKHTLLGFVEIENGIITHALQPTAFERYLILFFIFKLPQ